MSIIFALAAASRLPDPHHRTPKYNYGYDVNDDPNAVFSKTESRDDQQTNGEYCVNMPDGRVQIVTYTADHTNGFVADVKYEGTAVYPDLPAPAPKYAPAPPKYVPA